MPRRARRDIFADAKVILCRWHSDIIFAVYTREANITRQRRISLHSNTSRRKANITEKAIVKCNRFFMARVYLRHTRRKVCRGLRGDGRRESRARGRGV